MKTVPVTKWEYAAVDLLGYVAFEWLETKLNFLGRDGWELVSAQMSELPKNPRVTYADTDPIIGTRMIFKRPARQGRVRPRNASRSAVARGGAR